MRARAELLDRAGAVRPDATSLAGKDKIAIQGIANTCVSYFQTCQESWHPNAAGHAVLGKCLSGVAVSPARAVTCTRQPDGTIVTS